MTLAFTAPRAVRRRAGGRISPLSWTHAIGLQAAIFVFSDRGYLVPAFRSDRLVPHTAAPAALRMDVLMAGAAKAHQLSLPGRWVQQ